MTTDVSVPERGSTHVSASVWRTLASDETFWSLVDRKIVNPIARRDGSASLSAGNSVGFARCGDLNLRVREKIPGALGALLNRRLAGVRTYSLPGVFTREDALVERLVTAFTTAVLRYVTAGRDWRYQRIRKQGSVVGGRLLIRQTLMLRAQGRPQLAVFDRRHITHVTPINQCLAAALRVTEDLYTSGLIGAPTVAATRALAPFFYDNSTSEVLFGAPSWHARRAGDLAEELGGETGDLLHVAAVLLSGAGMSPVGDAAGHLPITWFINLEEAFEAGVRDAFGQGLGANWLVEKGGEEAYVFPVVPHLDVTPDLVLTRHADQARIVGDVKYKNLGGKPEAGDLYQLLAHATSLGSNVAFLVYPSDAFLHSRFGQSATGVHVDVFTVDVRDLDDAVGQIMSTLPIGSPR